MRSPNIMCKVADRENHVRWIYLTTVLCMGEGQKYAITNQNIMKKQQNPTLLINSIIVC